MANSNYMRTLSSFSGADLIVSFGPRPIGELQQISWGIEREKAPIYTLGSADYRSISRGKRGIGGSLIFAVFDRDALMEELKASWATIAPPAMFTAQGNLYKRNQANFENAISMAGWDAAAYSAAPGGFGRQEKGTDDRTNIYVPAGFGVIRQENILYPDMLPPFDVTMTFGNEYGQAAFQKIYDMDILNEGSGVSVDTVVMERRMTYVARRISPLMTGVYTSEQNGLLNNSPVYQV